ncbi:MAG: hypothetical protein JNJ59_09255 [Deltaproteobacteria bacterium]|nr:hypothetical protein [Deltaproteobacteria bacterium]
MALKMAMYLGRKVGDLIGTEPFSGWYVLRTIETDPKPEIRYEFEGHGVEVICDEFDRIRTLFFHRGDAESLVDIPFDLTRKEVLERLGRTAKSGQPVRLPGIGDRGAWDRFPLLNGALHIQYRTDRDDIEMITFMRSDAVP